MITLVNIKGTIGATPVDVTIAVSPDGYADLIKALMSTFTKLTGDFK